MSEFLRALDERVVIGDGALGTEIHARGVPLERPTGDFALREPDLLRRIHRAYVEAGAELVKTHTFMASRLRLREHGLEASAWEVNLAAARLAREAAGKEGFVAGSVGPLADLRSPGTIDAFREQCDALAEGGCDVLLLETFTDLQDLKVALEAARATKLPVVCQMAWVDGAAHEAGLAALAAEGADAIGVNCMDPDAARVALERMRSYSDGRLSVFPNAGLPARVGGRLVYPASPDAFAEAGRRLADAGARLVGGCCGAGPDHIRALAGRLRRT